MQKNNNSGVIERKTENILKKDCYRKQVKKMANLRKVLNIRILNIF